MFSQLTISLLYLNMNKIGQNMHKMIQFTYNFHNYGQIHSLRGALLCI